MGVIRGVVGEVLDELSDCHLLKTTLLLGISESDAYFTHLQSQYMSSC